MIDIRLEAVADHEAIRRIVAAAFGGDGEAALVDALRDDGDLLLSLVATAEEEVVGHIAFSRLVVEGVAERFPAVALAPVAVADQYRRQGIGKALIQAGHGRLAVRGESLFVVLGDPDYYKRFGYRRGLAEGFQSPWQSEALQAFAVGEFPRRGRLHYARAFDGL